MKTYITLLFILLTTQPALAQFDYGFDFSKAGSAGLQFLKIGVGAREVAMGEAVIGTVFDANAVFWNAAGLAKVNNKQFMLTHNRWLVNSTHTAAVVAVPVKQYVIGISAISFGIEEFEETTVTAPDGTGRMINAGDMLLGIAVAKQFTNKLSIGGQIKYVHEELDDRSFSNVLFDVGTIYLTGFRQLRLAFSLQHFGPDKKLADQQFRTPLLFRVNVGDDLISTDNYKLFTAVELVHPTDNNEWLNLGSEFTFKDLLAFRTGYRFNIDVGEISFGCGIQ